MSTPQTSYTEFEIATNTGIYSSNVSLTTKDNDWSQNGSSVPSFLEPKLIQAAWGLCYALITVLAIGGNFIVCYVIVSTKRMRTVTNYFIFNLSVSDFLLAVMCINPTFYPALLNHWPFGAVLCPCVMFLQSTSVLISSYTAVAICLDRYVAIIYPLTPRMTRTCALLVIALIWTIALTISTPIAIVTRITPPFTSYLGETQYACEETWPNEQSKMIYSQSLMVLQYFLPLMVLLFGYLRISFSLWGQKVPGEGESIRDARQTMAKKKLIKMLIVVVIIFGVCWLPLNSLILITSSHVEFLDYRHINHIFFGCHWLAMSSACVNPFIYCYMNARFRNGFKFFFYRFIPCLPTKREHTAVNGSSRHTVVSTLSSFKSRSSRGSSLRRSPGNTHSSISKV